MEGKGVSEKIMFTLVSQPWNGPAPIFSSLVTSQENTLINHLRHLASGLGGREFKTQPWLLFPGWSKPRMHRDGVVPSWQLAIVPRQRVWNIAFHIRAWHPDHLSLDGSISTPTIPAVSLSYVKHRFTIRDDECWRHLNARTSKLPSATNGERSLFLFLSASVGQTSSRKSKCSL